LEQTFTITYPRIVGKLEKISSLHIQALTQTSSTGIVRGAFEFQGQNVQQLQDLHSTKFMASD
jgi:hypothetical protein